MEHSTVYSHNTLP